MSKAALTAIKNDLPTAVAVDGMTPGTAEWRASVTASKVPAMLDLSPWETSFTLWLAMRGDYHPPQPRGSQLARGSHLEDGVARWWAEENPGWEMYGEATYQNTETPWAFARPDRVLVADDGELALLEVKTTARGDGWDEAQGIIPPHYWAQVAWQAHVTGVRRVFVTCLGPFLERMDFELVFTDFELRLLADSVEEFYRSVLDGAMPPVADAVRDLPALLATTPVEQEAADVTAGYAEYVAAKREEKAARDRVKRVQAELAAAGAGAGCLLADGRVVANRNEKGFRFNPVR